MRNYVFILVFLFSASDSFSIIGGQIFSQNKSSKLDVTSFTNDTVASKVKLIEATEASTFINNNLKNVFAFSNSITKEFSYWKKAKYIKVDHNYDILTLKSIANVFFNLKKKAFAYIDEKENIININSSKVITNTITLPKQNFHDSLVITTFGKMMALNTLNQSVFPYISRVHLTYRQYFFSTPVHALLKKRNDKDSLFNKLMFNTNS
ncbi:hypothetical protein F7018_10230 [Tenacibaculum aiptasiae]|uniref:Uncharacterized protein n=1 Tax=Tenacibaculum aiptasiae TaxID=426481 RepID=A0A7J5AJX1_9FLAO|nr:hypothetical protein [Tenacibaculum aiptasiae]KAB1157299.1 hypothetical protein F7018_10230 [Tenacibaculum aiptasiae]